MPSLRDVQRQVAHALFDGDLTDVAEIVLDSGYGRTAGLEVYRNNLRVGFEQALALEFPVLERLVGIDCFRQLARDYHTQHPSHSGDLHHVGESFADFLASRFADTEYQYLADVAELEWACELVSIAADDAPLPADALATVDADRYADLHLLRRAASRLVSSAFPVSHIWEANQRDRNAIESIDLRAGADNILVLRSRDGLVQLRLSSAELALLHALESSETLGAALDAALAADPNFDFAAAFGRLMAHGVFARFTLPD